MLAIIAEKCINCGLCGLVCPAQTDASGKIDGTSCIECGECLANCPEDAITTDSIFKEVK